jgi:hypothetical protein
MSEAVWIWGLPLAPMTRAAAADTAIALVKAGGPSYFITANVNDAILTHQIPLLRTIKRHGLG